MPFCNRILSPTQIQLPYTAFPDHCRPGRSTSWSPGGNQILEQHIQTYLDIAYLADLPDFMLIDFIAHVQSLFTRWPAVRSLFTRWPPVQSLFTRWLPVQSLLMSCRPCLEPQSQSLGVSRLAARVEDPPLVSVRATGSSAAMTHSSSLVSASAITRL